MNSSIHLDFALVRSTLKSKLRISNSICRILTRYISLIPPAKCILSKTYILKSKPSRISLISLFNVWVYKDFVAGGLSRPSSIYTKSYTDIIGTNKSAVVRDYSLLGSLERGKIAVLSLRSNPDYKENFQGFVTASSI